MKTRISSHARFVGLLGLVLAANSLTGQVMLSPVSVIETNLGMASETTPPENMINQSGIETPFVSGSTVFDVYFADPGQKFATSGNGGTNNWQSAVSFTLPLTGHVDFDLGAVYQINKIAIWNRSLKDITVNILDDLNGPEQVAGNFTLINTLSFNFSYVPEVLPFGATYQGRYVRLVINSVHTFSPSDTFGYAIVGEVVVSAAPVGPPSPTVSVARAPNGDVTVTFSDTLQTSTTVSGTFTNVPGNPQGSYTLPQGSLSPEQYFRARGN